MNGTTTIRMLHEHYYTAHTISKSADRIFNNVCAKLDVATITADWRTRADANTGVLVCLEVVVAIDGVFHDTTVEELTSTVLHTGLPHAIIVHQQVAILLDRISVTAAVWTIAQLDSVRADVTKHTVLHRDAVDAVTEPQAARSQMSKLACIEDDVVACSHHDSSRSLTVQQVKQHNATVRASDFIQDRNVSNSPAPSWKWLFDTSRSDSPRIHQRWRSLAAIPRTGTECLGT